MTGRPAQFRALAALLAYPEADLVAGLPSLKEIFSGDRELERLLQEMQQEELHVLQERYVELFDRSRALSLHLFEHVHGESRDRGQAMVDLAETYASRGMQAAGDELPDYLPVFLEFLSVVSPAEARGMLGETADILRAIGDRLADRGSRYSAIFATLLRACGEAGLTRTLAARADAAEDLEALDKAWMEEPVTFMGAPPPGGPGVPQPVVFHAKGARR